MVFRVYNKGRIVEDFDTFSEASAFIYGYCVAFETQPKYEEYGPNIIKVDIGLGDDKVFFIQEVTK